MKKFRIFIFFIFLLFPFQKPLFHKLLKTFSAAIIPPHLILPEYFSKKMSFFFIDILLIGLLIWIILFKKGQWWDFFWSGPSKYLTLLFIIAFFSIGVSSTSNYLLIYTRFLEMALVMVLFNSICMSFDAKSITPFITAFAWLLFLISLFESAIALLQYFTQSPLGLSLLGERSRHLFVFHSPNGYRTLFDALFHIQRTPELLMRSTGTFPHPNIFGGFQFCALMATCYLYFLQTKYKRLFLIGIVFQMLALTVIFSRAAVIALILSLSIWFVLHFRFQDTRKRLKPLGVTLLASAALSVTLFFPSLAARGGVVNYNSLVKAADRERVLYQDIALKMVQERPVFGVGLNNFQIESHRFFPEGRILPSSVHNIYLLFAAETGLLGAACFLLFIFSILRKSLACLRSPEGIFLFSIFLGLLFIGICDFYFIRPHGRILFFGIAALLYSLSKVLNNETLAEKKHAFR